jgi:hypothetical protein
VIIPEETVPLQCGLGSSILLSSAQAIHSSIHRFIRGGLMLGKVLKSFVFVMLLGVLAAAQTIPAGTPLTVRIGTEINSGRAQTGQSFDGVLARDVVVNGSTIAHSGSVVHGKVTSAKPSGRLHAPGQLTLRLTSMDVNGKRVALSTSGYYAKGKSHTKSNVTKIGGGAGAGALIGAFAGGGKGALIGAAVGGAAGTGVAAATGKEEAVIHAESSMTFKTTSAATVK